MIVDEFYAIAGRALKPHRGADSVRLVSIQPGPRGPDIRWEAPLLSRQRSRRELPGGGTVLGQPPGPLILDLLTETLAARWRNGRPHCPRDWSSRTARRHRRLFGQQGPETGPGWCWLWEAGARAITRSGVPRNFSTIQTKEKFGTLRWYFEAEEDASDTHEIIDAMDYLSGFICEDCGRPGAVRQGGWMRTLCQEHGKGRKSV